MGGLAERGDLCENSSKLAASANVSHDAIDACVFFFEEALALSQLKQWKVRMSELERHALPVISVIGARQFDLG